MGIEWYRASFSIELLTLSDKTFCHGHAIDFVEYLQQIHQHARTNMEMAASKYKAAADLKHHEVSLEVGDVVWMVLTKEILPLHEYNKFKFHKIGPQEVLECINANVYRVKLPPHLCTSDFFNVKHMSPFRGDNDSSDSWANPP